jgi:hypothetical protein
LKGLLNPPHLNPLPGGGEEEKVPSLLMRGLVTFSINSRREPIAAKITSWLSESEIGGLDFSFYGIAETAAFVEQFMLPRVEEMK